MSKIVSIGTAVPKYCHRQEDILQFMQTIYASTEAEKRKLRFLYHSSGIEQRYSVISDYSRPAHEWKFYPQTENLEPFPSLEQRMTIYNKKAPALSVEAIRNCLDHHQFHQKEVTHLITVSCTGLSAPGLDLHVAELMDLPKNISRTSINFMGCYAAIHALKIADAICKSNKNAQVLIVSTELCTLHFQREATMDNIMSSLLFGDGSAAALVVPDENEHNGIGLDNFYSEIIPRGKSDMAWELSSNGFLMTLSGYIPELLEQDFALIAEKSLKQSKVEIGDIKHWCIHPGGKRILDAIQKSLNFSNGQLQYSYDTLRQVGNISSATIFFVLKNILREKKSGGPIFGAAFGPGITVETFTAHTTF